MVAITVRGLDPEVKQKLRERAARHGRSMEAEARAILEKAVAGEFDSAESLLDVFRRLRGPEGGLTEAEARSINDARRNSTLLVATRDPFSGPGGA